MNRTLKATAFGFAGAVMMSAGSTGASASYLGYGNGDPGPWDFATEQAGGPCVNTSDPKCCLQYNPISACPLVNAYFNPEWSRYRGRALPRRAPPPTSVE